MNQGIPIEFNTELLRHNSTDIQHQLIEMGFELHLINNILHHFEILSLDQAIEYLTRENGKWNHPYLNLENENNSQELLCIICRDVPNNHLINFLRESHVEQTLNKEEIEKNFKIMIDRINHPQNDSEIILKSNEKLCNICLGPINGIIKLNCHHEFCYDCINGYLVNKINYSDVEKITCPDGECQFEIEKELIKHYVFAKDFQRYEKFLLRANILKIPGRVVCPIPDCDSYAVMKEEKNEIKLTVTSNMNKDDNNISLDSININNQGNNLNSDKSSEENKLDKISHENPDNNNKHVLENENKSTFLTCEKGHHFCRKCNLQAHVGFDCERKLKKDFSSWAGKTLVKRCPKCQFIIEKNEGCNHMTCGNKSCNYQFCWICLEEFKDRHYASVLSPCYGLQYSNNILLAKHSWLRYLKIFFTIILILILICLALFLSFTLGILYLYFKGKMLQTSFNIYPNTIRKKLELIVFFQVLILTIPLIPLGWIILSCGLAISPFVMLFIWIKKRR